MGASRPGTRFADIDLEQALARSTLTDWQQLGVYTPDSAARLLGINSGMIRRWLYGNNAGQAALVPQVPAHDGRLLTFIDLVQSMAIRDIRADKKVSLQKIRQTVEAANRHGVIYPFARLHTTYVFSDDIVLRLNDGHLIQVTGKYREQDLMEPIIEEYLNDLGYDDEGFANSYAPKRSGFRTVVLSPRTNYGAPTVLPCTYTVATLLDAVVSEGSIEAAAQVCDVNENDIRLAMEYEQSLGRAA